MFSPQITRHRQRVGDRWRRVLARACAAKVMHDSRLGTGKAIKITGGLLKAPDLRPLPAHIWHVLMFKPF